MNTDGLRYDTPEVWGPCPLCGRQAETTVHGHPLIYCPCCQDVASLGKLPAARFSLQQRVGIPAGRDVRMLTVTDIVCLAFNHRPDFLLGLSDHQWYWQRDLARWNLGTSAGDHWRFERTTAVSATHVGVAVDQSIIPLSIGEWHPQRCGINESAAWRRAAVACDGRDPGPNAELVLLHPTVQPVATAAWRPRCGCAVRNQHRQTAATALARQLARVDAPRPQPRRIG